MEPLVLKSLRAVRNGVARTVLVLCAAGAAACAGAPAGGEVAPAVVSTDALVDGPHVGLDGEPLDLRSGLAAGRPLVLVFWQTWCGSCREEAPALAAAARRLAGRADFVGVVPGPDDAVDDDEVRAVSDQLGLPYRHLRDRDLAWTRGLDVEGTPTLVALGPDGSVLWRGHRPPKDWALVLGL